MDLNDLHPPDDYSHRSFIWHEWIQARGPLTHENVFEYFTTSMFYDKQSNNQVLRMQTMHTGLPLLNEAEELKRFTGIEFAVVHSQPPTFFIIHKRERLSPDEVRPIAAYFIANNHIYQSPDVYTLVSNRLLTSLNSLQTSLDILRQYRPAYTPRTGFVWPIREAATPADNKKKTQDGEPDQSQSISDATTRKDEPPSGANVKRQENNTALMCAMATTAQHARQSFVLPTAPTEAAVPETPVSVTVGRSSATPAPSQPSATPRGSISQEATAMKTTIGGGKKKKKRASIVG